MNATVTNSAPPQNTRALRLAFAGTPEFAVPSLMMLLQAQQHVLAVYTQPDRPAGRGRHLHPSPVKACALAHGLDVRQPKNFRDPSLVAELAALKLDALIVVAYGHILPQAILDVPRWGCLNVHASLLPRWRGAAPIQQALLAGDVETGITIMQMAAGLDTGPMLTQARCQIQEDDTSQQLHDRLAILGAATLQQTLQNFMTDTITSTPQDDRLATYAAKIQKQDAQIDWQLPASTVLRQIRAYHPWPICFSPIDGITLRIWAAQHSAVSATTNTAHGSPGSIVAIDKNGMDVATGDGCVRITRAQMPNKPVISGADVVHAYAQHFSVGKRFD